MQGLQGALARGRAAAAQRMLSRCTVRRKTGATTVVDGVKVPVWAVVHTDLPLRLEGKTDSASQSRRVETAGVEYELALRTAHFPAASTNLIDGDLIDVTSGESAGLVLRIIEADRSDQTTARRVPVVATQRPSEWSA